MLLPDVLAQLRVTVVGVEIRPPRGSFPENGGQFCSSASGCVAESSFCCADERKNERKNESSSNDDAIATTVSFLLFSFEVVVVVLSRDKRTMRALEGNEGN